MGGTTFNNAITEASATFTKKSKKKKKDKMEIPVENPIELDTAVPSEEYSYVKKKKKKKKAVIVNDVSNVLEYSSANDTDKCNVKHKKNKSNTSSQLDTNKSFENDDSVTKKKRQTIGSPIEFSQSSIQYNSTMNQEVPLAKKKKKKKSTNLIKNNITDELEISSTVDTDNLIAKKKKKRKIADELTNVTDFENNNFAMHKKNKTAIFRSDSNLNASTLTDLSIECNGTLTAENTIVKKKKKKLKDQDSLDLSDIIDSVLQESPTDSTSKRKRKNSPIRIDDASNKSPKKIQSTDEYETEVVSVTKKKRSKNHTCNSECDSPMKSPKKDNFKKSEDNGFIDRILSNPIKETNNSKLFYDKGPKPTKSTQQKCLGSFVNKPTIVPTTMHDCKEMVKLESHYISSSQLASLQNLEILLPFMVPVLHTIEKVITNRPTKEVNQIINSLDVKVKNGRFNKLEDETIMRNWEHFYKLHGLKNNPKLFMQLRYKNEYIMKRNASKQFGQFLAHDLNDRLLSSVYARFVRLVEQSERKVGRFTSDEDSVIIRYVDSCRSVTPFADLSKIVKRSNESIARRYYYLKSEPVSFKWTTELSDKLVRKILKVTNCTKRKHLRDHEITEEEWSKIEKKMKTVSIFRIKRHWYVSLYPQYFVKKNTYKVDIKRKLVNLLIKRGCDDYVSIPWKKLVKNFDGFTRQKLAITFLEMLHTDVPATRRRYLQEALQYMQRALISKPSIRIRTTSKNLSESEEFTS